MLRDLASNEVLELGSVDWLALLLAEDVRRYNLVRLTSHDDVFFLCYFVVFKEGHNNCCVIPAPVFTRTGSDGDLRLRLNNDLPSLAVFDREGKKEYVIVN